MAVEERETRAEELYRRFCATRQEPVRLAAALEGYFMGGSVGEAQRGAYAAYLKRRIRPAVQRLLEEDEAAKIRALEKNGWFGLRELDDFLREAQEKRSFASLIWLLRRKGERYGFTDRDFSV